MCEGPPVTRRILRMTVERESCRLVWLMHVLGVTHKVHVTEHGVEKLNAYEGPLGLYRRDQSS